MHMHVRGQLEAESKNVAELKTEVSLDIQLAAAHTTYDCSCTLLQLRFIDVCA